MGIAKGDLERNCSEHEICGSIVEVGSILHVVHERNYWGRQWRDDLVLYHHECGSDGCKVGFLSKKYSSHAGQLNGKYIQVTDVYTLFDADEGRRRCVHTNHGFAKAVLIDHVDLTDE